MKTLIYVTLVSILSLLPLCSFAYEPTSTHAGLSQEIVSFYNEHYERKLTNEEGELIIKGSMEEDDPVYRALNHFYDPIRNIGFNDGHTAIDWAFSPTLQKFDVLSGIGDQDYSWPRALDDYAKGDERRALIALGHTVHLLEDMSVPDHTRNDPHSGDAYTHASPYETWTKLNKNRETMRGLGQAWYSKGDRPYERSSGAELLDFVANYSNRNFFSLDTIAGSIYRYKSPTISKLDDTYAYGLDSEHGDNFKLLRIENVEGKFVKTLDSKDDHSVMIEYFDRLARQDIRAGAGLIHLFLTEAKAAREKYEAENAARAAAAARAALELANAQKNSGKLGIAYTKIKYYLITPVSNTFSNIAQNTTSGLSLTYNFTTQNVQNFASVFSFTAKEIAAESGRKIASSKAAPVYYITKSSVPNKPKILARASESASQQVQSGTNKTFTDSEVRQISEIASLNNLQPARDLNLGTLATTSSLTLELSTTTTTDTKADSISVASNSSNQNIYQPGFGGGGTPPPPVIIAVVEEEPPLPILDTTAPDISLTLPDCAHSLAADDSVCLIATTTLAIAWSSSADDLDHFSLAVFDGSATTTENIASTTLSKLFTVTDNKNYQIEIGAYDNVGNGATSTLKFAEINLKPIVINEIAWAGTAASAFDEWIELKNLTSYNLKLSEILLESFTDQGPSIMLTGTLAPNAFYLLERRDDNTVSNVTADLVYGDGSADWSLLNSGEELRLSQVYNTTSILLDSTPEISDCDGWCSGEGSPTYASMQRMENGDYDTYLLDTSDALDRDGLTIFGTPKAENNFEISAPPLQ